MQPSWDLLISSMERIQNPRRTLMIWRCIDKISARVHENPSIFKVLEATIPDFIRYQVQDPRDQTPSIHCSNGPHLQKGPELKKAETDPPTLTPPLSVLNSPSSIGFLEATPAGLSLECTTIIISPLGFTKCARLVLISTPHVRPSSQSPGPAWRSRDPSAQEEDAGPVFVYSMQIPKVR
jgi:hypothetical protein